MSNQNVVENSTPGAEEKIPMSIEKKNIPKKNFLEISCPNCHGTNFVKRRTRQKKNEIVQLYLCNDCQKTFTPGATKGKHHSIGVILDAISLYYIGYSLEESARRVSQIINENKTSHFQSSSEVVNNGQKGTAMGESRGNSFVFDKYIII
ncbi:MAG: hypothetical protein WA064_02815 [Candidatus Moraniibacteriota bacterium]